MAVVASNGATNRNAVLAIQLHRHQCMHYIAMERPYWIIANLLLSQSTIKRNSGVGRYCILGAKALHKTLVARPLNMSTLIQFTLFLE